MEDRLSRIFSAPAPTKGSGRARRFETASLMLYMLLKSVAAIKSALDANSPFFFTQNAHLYPRPSWRSCWHS